MKELGDLKFLAQSVILQQELIVLRLAASLCHREDAAIENRRLGTLIRGVYIVCIGRGNRNLHT